MHGVCDPKLEVTTCLNPTGLLLKHNVCYVVGMVLMREGKVLLIQEAKQSCRGSWYLPAGRVEPNETLEVSVGF